GVAARPLAAVGRCAHHPGRSRAHRHAGRAVAGRPVALERGAAPLRRARAVAVRAAAATPGRRAGRGLGVLTTPAPGAHLRGSVAYFVALAAALAAAAGALGSSNLAPPLLAMKTTARAISKSLESPPPCAGMLPLPFNAECSSASKPVLTRGAQAASSPIFGAPTAP